MRKNRHKKTINLIDKYVDMVGEAVARIWDKEIIDALMTEDPYMEMEIKKTFVEYAELYPLLGNRFWKRKRDIEKFLARNIYRFLPLIKKDMENPVIVKFKRYGKIEAKKSKRK